MTRTVMLGLAAVTIVFLSSFGGMVSLAQLLFVGIAGFMVGNAVGEGGHEGPQTRLESVARGRVRARGDRPCVALGLGAAGVTHDAASTSSC